MSTNGKKKRTAIKTLKSLRTFKKYHDLTHDFDVLKKSLMGASSNVKGQAEHVKENIENYISVKPFKSVGMAVLTGLVFGYLWRR